MKVLDATFLIDYLDGIEATKAFYEASGAEDERWVMPVPAYAEALVGEGNVPNGDVAGARADLSWGETYAVDERTAATAGEIADEVAPRRSVLGRSRRTDRGGRARTGRAGGLQRRRPHSRRDAKSRRRRRVPRVVSRSSCDNDQ